MKIVIEILIMLTCLLILIQDFRDRLISVLLFILAMGLIGIHFYCYNQWEENISLLAGNYLFAIAQTGFLYIYFIHIRKMPAFFDAVIGWGDLAMIGCMAFVFPLPYFILFLMVSYFSGIVFSLATNIYTNPSITIPLAGIMGMIYILNLLFFYTTGYLALKTFTL